MQKHGLAFNEIAAFAFVNGSASQRMENCGTGHLRHCFWGVSVQLARSTRVVCTFVKVCTCKVCGKGEKSSCCSSFATDWRGGWGGKGGSGSVSNLGDLYGVVLLVVFLFWFFLSFLSKFHLFGLWFPCVVHEVAAQIGHQGCSKKNFTAPLRYPCIYPPATQACFYRCCQMEEESGWAWPGCLNLERLLMPGPVVPAGPAGCAGCTRGLGALWPQLHTATGPACCGFALAGPAPRRAQSAALADVFGSGEKLLASVDLSFHTFVFYRSSE